MRIRKHAARVLPSLSIPVQSYAAAVAATGLEMGMHVCELNQSPWDAMAFTPPGGVSLYDYQVLEEMEEDDGFAWGATGSGQTDEEAATVSDVSGVSTTESTLRRRVKMEEQLMADAAEADEEKRERKKDATKRGTSNATRKTKRKNTSSCASAGEDDEKVEVEVGSSPTASAASTACKKTDGKGWHCKREARHPHSLCEYHLVQVRSHYYSNGGVSSPHALQHLQQQQQQQQSLPDRKKTTKKKGNNNNSYGAGAGAGAGRTRRKPPSDFFYYYSGFGPWRGKRRSGGGDGDGGDRGTCNVDASDGGDAADGGAHDGVPLPGVHDQAPDDLDDDDDDLDGECEGEDVVASGRRRRKPVKARSLKSLL